MSKHCFVGIDVSARELTVALAAGGKKAKGLGVYANDAGGHRALLKRLKRLGGAVRVCLESTGNYGLDLALALERLSGVEVMVVNPKAARKFAEVMMARGKTDSIDAGLLAEFAARMPFEPWRAPGKDALSLRSLSRRIAQLVKLSTQEKNRLHADRATVTGGAASDIKAHIRFLERRTQKLRSQAEALIKGDETLRQKYALLISVKGIARSSAIQILGELAALPADMDKRQLSAHAGLAPQPHQSGTVKRPSRVSKAANSYLKRALYMPALVACRHEPGVAAFRAHLVDGGKKPIQAVIAVMRKLLCAICGMFSSGAAFDGSKFFNPAVAVRG